MAENDGRRPPARSGRRSEHLAERRILPAQDLFERIRRQAALLAIAEEHRRDEDPVGRAVAIGFRDYALASDQALAVSGPVSAATLGWMSPIGILGLLVTSGCRDELVVEHVAAALAAMNGVALAVDEPQRSRLAPMLRSLARFLPEAFAELEPGPDAVYPVGVTVLALAPETLYRAASAPVELPRSGRGTAERLDVLAVYSRIREMGVEGRR